jgi:hypothetical protein
MFPLWLASPSLSLDAPVLFTVLSAEGEDLLPWRDVLWHPELWYRSCLKGIFQCRGYSTWVSISEHGDSPQTQVPFSERSLPACWLGINHKAVHSTLLWSKDIHVPRAQWVSVAHLFTIYLHASIVWFLIIVVLVQFNLLQSFSLSEGIMNYERWKTVRE